MEPKEVRIEVPPIELDITVEAFQKYASDFLNAAQAYSHPREEYFSPVPYYLYCHAMELALKGYILQHDRTKLSDLITKVKHDLIMALDLVEEINTEPFLSSEEREVVAYLGEYYGSKAEQKGFEYINLAMKASMLRGYSDLPSLEIVKSISLKLWSAMFAAHTSSS